MNGSQRIRTSPVVCETANAVSGGRGTQASAVTWGMGAAFHGYRRIMPRFSAETRAEAVVGATRADIWAALTDPALVAELTPFVRRITEDGDHWYWEMTGLKVLGAGIAPAFTERMTYDEPSRIEFRHDPPSGANERSAVEGWYSLEEVASGTRLTTALSITLDLPLPRASGRAVRAAMSKVIDQMGDRFSKGLLAHLGAEEVA